jgi:hypothetical protein
MKSSRSSRRSHTSLQHRIASQLAAAWSNARRTGEVKFD